MDKILIMSQDESNKIKDIIEKDIWGSINDFLNWGLHIGEGDKSIHVTVGLLLTITIAFIITDSFIALKIKSEVRYKIDAKLREHSIAIPFPQRDVHLFQHIKNQ